MTPGTHEEGTDVVIEDDLLARADEIAAREHHGQVDKSGAPYIDLLRRVAQRVAEHGGSVEQQAAALLHDVLDDSATTLDDLRAQGMPETVVDLVAALTKVEGEDYDQAVSRAAADPLARLIKRSDLEEKSDPERLARLSGPTRQHLEAKYRRAFRVLEQAEGLTV
jgi:(p)ppGpp synthase/HD superfamily hydrolase